MFVTLKYFCKNDQIYLKYVRYFIVKIRGVRMISLTGNSLTTLHKSVNYYYTIFFIDFHREIYHEETEIIRSTINTTCLIMIKYKRNLSF